MLWKEELDEEMLLWKQKLEKKMLLWKQKFEKKIQTLGLRSSVIGAKDPEKPTKCDGDSVVLSF